MSVFRNEKAGEDMDIGGNVHARRILQGKTMKQLANEIGVSDGMVAHIEAGRKMPSLHTAVKLAEALGCTVDELLGGRQSQTEAGGGKSSWPLCGSLTGGGRTTE